MDVVLGLSAAVLFGISVMMGRVSLAELRGGGLAALGRDIGYRAFAATLAFPAQLALIAWLFVHLSWYWAVAALLAGLFVFGPQVNRANLAGARAAKPVMDTIVILGTIGIWAVSMADDLVQWRSPAIEPYLWFVVGALALCVFDPFVWILTILAAWRSREWLDAALWPLAIALGYGTAAHVALDAMDAYAATLGWEGRMVRVLIGALVMTLAAHAVFRWRRRRVLSG